MEIELDIYSPRWGHDDVYRFVFERDSLTFSMGPREGRFIWDERTDPVHDGEDLLDIFGNDSIYAPEAFVDGIVYAWKAWRNGDLSDENLNQEMQAWGEWLNTITRHKPRTDFWRGYF
ncbi:hypothetical protein [Shewanella algae]